MDQLFFRFSSYIELEFRTFDLAYYGQMKSSLRKLRF